MPSPRRLLVFSTSIPHATRGANAVALFQYIKSFRDAGYEILHVVLLKQGTFDEAELKQYVSDFSSELFQIHALTVPGFYKSGRSILQSFEPIDVPLPMREVVQGFSPDLCVCFDIAAAGFWATFLHRAKTLVWLGDLNFQVSWYKALYAAKEQWINIFSLPRAWIESRKWKTFYKKVLSSVNRTIVTAKSSEKELQRCGISSRYLAYAWPELPSASAPITRPSKPTFVFFGHLAGLGSRSALHFLLDELYPKLLDLWGRQGFSIVMCGTGNVPDWAQSKMKEMSELKHVGFVDDLGALLLSSHAVIIPIDIPIGNRTRIITAMALGVPVIAHSNTALGNPSLVDLQTCYLARNAAGFVERMQRAFECPDEVQSIVKRARHVYDTEYSPSVACAAMLRELERLS